MGSIQLRRRPPTLRSSILRFSGFSHMLCNLALFFLSCRVVRMIFYARRATPHQPTENQQPKERNKPHQTNHTKQTNKQASKQTNKQASKQADNFIIGGFQDCFFVDFARFLCGFWTQHGGGVKPSWPSSVNCDRVLLKAWSFCMASFP